MKYSLGLVTGVSIVVGWHLFGKHFNRWWSGRNDRWEEKREREKTL